MTHFFSRGRIWQALGNDRQRGFSLVEIALVLVIIGLALGGIIAAMGPQLEQRKYGDTQKRLDEAGEAIVAFSLVNRRLPCPATVNSAGRESFCNNAVGGCGAEVIPPLSSAGRTNGRCAAPANGGFVPAATLGLSGQRADGRIIDAWAAPLRYVAPNVTNTTTNNPDTVLGCAAGNPCYPYTQVNGIRNAYYTSGVIGSTPPGNTISSDIFVCSTATGINAVNCNTAPQRANPAFLVHSLGLNRPPIGTDETANTNADRVFVIHEKTEADAPLPNGGFDDLLGWTTFEQLIARLSGANTP